MQRRPSLLRRAASRTWAVLMTPVGERVPMRQAGKGGKKGAPHGIALLTVLLGLSLMSTIVTDLGYNEMVRYKLAAHDRDAMKAQALAESGVNVARLLLAAQSALQPLLVKAVQFVPLPAHTVWDLVPLESDLLKGVADGSIQTMIGLDMTEALAEREEKQRELREDAEADFDAEKEGAGNGPFVPPPGGFGAFEGSFGVKIEDEERKAVTLRGWTSSNNRFAVAQRVYSLIQSERFDFLFEERDSEGNRTDRYEFIANLYDWMDANEESTDPRAEPEAWGRLGGGSEDGLYSAYGDVVPKNEYFDSAGELRLVRGMTDAHWKAFGEDISIYGDPKVNILSATPLAVESLVRACAENPQDPLLFDPIWLQQTVQFWFQCKMVPAFTGQGCTPSEDGFVAYLASGMATQDGRLLAVNTEDCKAMIGTESKNFTVRSTGRVGDVERTITLVVRVHGAIEERYFYSIIR